jgi:hypothetical protein
MLEELASAVVRTLRPTSKSSCSAKKLQLSWLKQKLPEHRATSSKLKA